jgi:hypothetical protein
MGTSKRWRGPAGGNWGAARDCLSRLTRGLSESLPDDSLDSAGINGTDVDQDELRDRIDRNAELVGQRLLQGLAEMLAVDPEALNLRTITLRAAGRLVDTLEELLTDGVVAVCPLRSASPEERADEFISAFADRVAEPNGLIIDSVIRRASVHCAERLLSEDSPIAASINSGNPNAKISGDLFCFIYALFFADTVSEFLTAVVTEKVKIIIPALYADPTGQIAKWIANNIVGLVPDPCEEQEKLVSEVRPLADMARELISDSVDRVLGLGLQKVA